MRTNQKAALKAFMSSDNRTVADVAEDCGLTPRTIFNYLADPEFKSTLNQKQDAVISQATARLATLTRKAISGLEAVIDNPTQEGATNLRLASKDVLSLLDTYTDREIDQRLAALEKKVFEN